MNSSGSSGSASGSTGGNAVVSTGGTSQSSPGNIASGGGRDQDKSGDKDDTRGKPKTAARAPAEKPREEAKPPPATLAEVFERLFKPAETSGAKSSAAPSPAGKSSATGAAAAAGAAGAAISKPAAAKTVPASGPGDMAVLNPFGRQSFTRNEVLAENLKPSTIERAQTRGFVVGVPAPLSNLNSSVTRLTAPSDMDALQAQAWLRTELPGERFALNRVYGLYRAADEGTQREAGRTAPARKVGADACDGDRCAGRHAIQWKNELQSCSKGMRIGVIDTDVDHHHPAFSARPQRIGMGTFIPEGKTPAPNWHGTGVVALLAGDPSSGTPGLIPDGEFYAAGVFFTDPSGDFATDTVSILKALDWMSALNVKVVNMSFAGPRDELVQKAIARLAGKGMVFVAAAGNEGPTAAPSYPAAYKQVMAVTAVNRELRNYAYANRGGHIDVAAPGVRIWTAVPDAQEGYRSGTSFAAPYVTAIVATMLNGSPRRQKDDLLSLLRIVDLGPPGRDPIYGHGLLMAPAGCQPGFTTETAIAKPSDAPAVVMPASLSAGVPSATTIGTTSAPGVAAGYR